MSTAPSYLDRLFTRPLLMFLGGLFPNRSNWSFEGPSVALVDDAVNDTTHVVFNGAGGPPTGLAQHRMFGNTDIATSTDVSAPILDVLHQNETADALLVFENVPTTNAAEYLQVIRNGLAYNLTIQLGQLAPVVQIGPGLSTLVRFGQTGVYNAVTGAPVQGS